MSVRFISNIRMINLERFNDHYTDEFKDDTEKWVELNHFLFADINVLELSEDNVSKQVYHHEQVGFSSEEFVFRFIIDGYAFGICKKWFSSLAELNKEVPVPHSRMVENALLALI